MKNKNIQCFMLFKWRKGNNNWLKIEKNIYVAKKELCNKLFYTKPYAKNLYSVKFVGMDKAFRKLTILSLSFEVADIDLFSFYSLNTLLSFKVYFV